MVGAKSSNVVQIGQTMFDRLTNFLSGLGTEKDKAAAGTWLFSELNQQTIENAFRSDWMVQKIITIPPEDATREWRSWYASERDIAAIEEVEEVFDLQQKVYEAMWKARLYGGAGMILGVDGHGNANQPLDVTKVSEGQLRFVHVMTRHEMKAANLIRDPLNPLYGEPSMYQVNSESKGLVEIHPSRVIRFIGAARPSVATSLDGWGDSTLQAIQSAVQDGGQAMAAVAALVQEAKVDVIKVPRLTQILSDEKQAERLQNRFLTANVLKSMINSLLLDAEEEWERQEVSFTGLPDVIKLLLLVVSGAADIPATRMLGQSPAGLNSTGESDIRNYYDKIASMQNTHLSKQLRRLDDVIKRTAGAKDPDDIYYEWNPLWQLTDVEAAARDKQQAETWKIDKDAGIFDDVVLARARSAQIEESGVYPGWQTLLEEVNGDVEALMGEEDEPMLAQEGNPQIAEQFAAQKQAQATDARRRVVRDMRPRPLYVWRKVLNSKAILAWARAAGIANLVAADDLHVTVVYSRAPVDWFKAGESWSFGEDASGNLTVPAGGPRVVERFDKGALVLQFASSALSYRHCDILARCEGSHDYPEYLPHITLSYDPGEIDPASIEPYSGPIKLGPEIFQELKVPGPTMDGGECGVIRDPETGQFEGSLPCGSGTGEDVSGDEALERYKEDENVARDINDLHRGEWQGHGTESKEEAQRLSDAIDRHIAQNAKPTPSVLYRGTNLEWVFPDEDPSLGTDSLVERLQDRVGDDLVDSGFQSTTVSESVARGFATRRTGTPVVIEYHMLGSARGVPLVSLSNYTGGEQEWLLPRETGGEIDSITQRDGVIRVVVRETETPIPRARGMDGGECGVIRDPKTGKFKGSLPCGSGGEDDTKPRSRDDGRSRERSGPAVKEAQEMFNEMFPEGISEEGAEALQAYSLDEYENINAALRSGMRLKEIPRDTRGLILEMDKVFDGASLSRPTVVYRGLTDEAWESMKALSFNKAGTEFLDLGFVSTSMRERVTEWFAQMDGGEGVIMEIHLPKGARALPLNGKAAEPKEAEILIDRGSRFRVVSAKKRRIKVEWVK